MNQQKVIGWAIIFFHLVGAAGYLLPSFVPYMRLLTPVNLLGLSLLILFVHPNRSRGFYAFALCAGILGFFIEVIGVKTGAIFGNYTYGATLGFQWLEVPLVIGANWMVLAICSRSLVAGVEKKWLQAALAAAIMVALDVLIEPVAVTFDYWHWSGDSIPFQNYIGWWLTAFAMQLMVPLFHFRIQHPLAAYSMAAQFIFFMVLNLFV